MDENRARVPCCTVLSRAAPQGWSADSGKEVGVAAVEAAEDDPVFDMSESEKEQA